MRVPAAFGFACARLVHLEFASAPDLYLGVPDMLRDALGFAGSATLTLSELLRDEKNALGILKCAFAHLKFPSPASNALGLSRCTCSCGLGI